MLSKICLLSLYMWHMSSRRITGERITLKRLTPDWLDWHSQTGLKSSYPVLSVHVFVCVPLSCQERPLPTDYFSGEECCESWILLWRSKRERETGEWVRSNAKLKSNDGAKPTCKSTSWRYAFRAAARTCDRKRYYSKKNISASEIKLGPF